QGAKFGEYRIKEEIARGGMGVVYLAEQEHPRRNVALKLLPQNVSNDPTFRERFLEESDAAAAIDHPHILPIYAAGQNEGKLYIAMRYVEGSDLRAILERDGSVGPDLAARVVRQVASALDAAHGHGLIHRDVKPGNI